MKVVAQPIFLTLHGRDMHILTTEGGNLPWIFSMDKHPFETILQRFKIADPTQLITLPVRYDYNDWEPATRAPYVQWLPEPVEVGKQYKWKCLRDIVEFSQGGDSVCDALALFWKGMPTYNSVFDGVDGFGVPERRRMNWTFFGGTFRPWHDGHETVLINAIHSTEERSNVVVIPDTNPKKERARNMCAWHRYRDIVRHVAHLDCTVFPGYIQMDTPNPTYRWIAQMDAHEHINFVLGDDSLDTLPTWEHSDRLLARLSTLYVAPRNTREVNQANRDLVARSVQIHRLPQHAYMDVSSTAIRESV